MTEIREDVPLPEPEYVAVVLTKRDGPLSVVSIDFVDGGILVVDGFARNVRFFPSHAFDEVILSFGAFDKDDDPAAGVKGHEGSE